MELRASGSSNPTRVLIVEDDSGMRSAFRSLIESEPDMEVVGELASGTEAIEAVRRLAPDLVLLDVELPGLNGIELMRRIGPDRVPAVIFVTGHEEYAAEAFQVNAFDYIVKPFTDQRFRATLDRVRRYLRRDNIQDLSERLSALLAEVRSKGHYPQRLWVEADAKYSCVHLRGGETHRLREPISRVEARLDPSRFARVHRSAIVNLDRVVEVLSGAGSQTVVMKDGTRVPMSRSQKLRVFELAGEEA